MEVQKPRSWWGRNWKWFVPVVCILPLITCAGVCTGLVGGAFGVLKSSWAYTEGVALAQNNPTVIAELGKPIEPSWMVTGNINVNGNSGNATLVIPLSGPKNKGVLFVTATQKGEAWSFEQAEVLINGRADKINLLPEKPKKK
jgi:hypothetical protein